MKLSNKIVDTVVSGAIGEDVLPLTRYLKNKKNISEFKLAEVIKQEVNTTRNMLYRLYDYNLVSFIRKKDKKKGWYIYYWTFNIKRIKYLSLEMKKKRIETLKERLKRENETHFFACNSSCIRLDFEQATNFEFKCPECGSLVDMEDNAEKIKSIETEIKQLASEIKKK